MAESANIVIFKIVIGPLLFLILMIFANYFWFRHLKRQAKKWNEWLGKKPSKQEYLNQNSLNGNEQILCSFCSGSRLNSRIQIFIPLDIEHGLFFNRLGGEKKFVSYYCSKCGTELFRLCE